jgi:hypothetical protein
MYRVFVASVLAVVLILQALSIASAYERSLGNMRDDYWTVEKSLGNMQVPVGPGIDARLLEFTAPEFLAPLPARRNENMCTPACTYCRDGCTWHWRTNCFGDSCEPQFAQCMASCWRRSCQGCRINRFEVTDVYERESIKIEPGRGVYERDVEIYERGPYSPRPFK